MRELGAEVLAAACLIDRSAGKADVGVPLIALAEYKVPAYPADRLPPELAAIPPVKPGSRKPLRWLSRPMIIGIGSDLIDIRRIEKSLERHGERFVRASSPTVETGKSERRAERAASYAKRFAAKEACAKALGTRHARGVFWRDMGVVNLPGGKPTMQLTGVRRRGCRLLPAGHRADDPRDHHRRIPARPGIRDHRGGAGRVTATVLRSTAGFATRQRRLPGRGFNR